MNIEALLWQSLQLLGLGMGAVFVILALLIALISLVSRLVPPEPVVSPPPARAGIPPEHVAAISAAVKSHRNRR